MKQSFALVPFFALLLALALVFSGCTVERANTPNESKPPVTTPEGTTDSKDTEDSPGEKEDPPSEEPTEKTEEPTEEPEGPTEEPEEPPHVIPPVKPPVVFPEEPEEPVEEPEELLTFTGITLTSVIATYDKEVHHPILNGAPAFAEVSAFSADPVSAGTYTVFVTVTAEGYEPLTLSASVEIKPAEMSLTFDSLTVFADEKAHALTLAGSLPEGSAVTYYEICGENRKTVEKSALSRIEIGDYSFSVEVICENYTTFSATAELKIKNAPTKAAITKIGDTVLYQNPGDGYALYTETAKLSEDVYSVLCPRSENSFFGLCVSESPFTLYALTLAEDPADGISRVAILRDNIDCLAFADATRFYYSVSVGVPGIHEVTLSGNQITENRLICSGKFENLCLNSDKSKLFFTDCEENDLLCQIDLSDPTYPIPCIDDCCFDVFAVMDDVICGSRSGVGTVRYDLSTGERTVLSALCFSDFCVFDGKLLFISSDSEASYVFWLDLASGTLADEPLVSQRPPAVVSSLAAFGDCICYLNVSRLYTRPVRVLTSDFPVF